MPARLALAAVVAFAGSALAAEPYPDRPITLIVPYAAGGSSDVLGRLLGERLSKSLGQPIVIDNRAGAGSRLGIEIAAKSAPDGYTLLLADMPHTIIPAIQKGVRYDPVRDFMPVGLIGTASMFFFVNPAVKAETAQDFVALAKADPEKITIASGGIGSATHLTAELFQAGAGIKLVHVPFRGAGRVQFSLAFERSRSQVRLGWRRTRILRHLEKAASTSSSSIGGVCWLRRACRRRRPHD
jgi:tripartite-type tricarboxylate transporter receptor subunit TctC